MRTGLFGGAFNPVHNGHIAIIKTAIKEAELDRLILIPTGNAPHKKESVISREDRFNMLCAAVENEENIIVSDYELKREEVSYSADTVEYFKSIYPHDELFFIIGDDSYNQLSFWREPERILAASILLVFPREGAVVEPPALAINMEKVHISSSDVRKKIKSGKDFKNLLPKQVFDYIIKNNLYVEE